MANNNKFPPNHALQSKLREWDLNSLRLHPSKLKPRRVYVAKRKRFNATAIDLPAISATEAYGCANIMMLLYANDQSMAA